MVKPKLLDQVRAAVRVRHLSYRTEQAYVDWIKRFILFHKKRNLMDSIVKETDPGVLKSFSREDLIELLSAPFDD